MPCSPLQRIFRSYLFLYLSFLHLDLKDKVLGAVTYPLISFLSYSGNCSRFTCGRFTLLQGVWRCAARKRDCWDSLSEELLFPTLPEAA